MLLTSMPRELLTNLLHFKFHDAAMSLYNDCTTVQSHGLLSDEEQRKHIHNSYEFE